jgi:hypothetical protein
MNRWAWLAGIVTCTGCISPRDTQFLSWYARPVNVEARAFEYHDPFPDESAGPDTATRPHAYLEPRSDTRKEFELRVLQAYHPAAGGPQYARGPQPLWRIPPATALSPQYAPKSVLPPEASGPIAARPLFPGGTIVPQ